MTTDLRGEMGRIKAPVTLLYAQDDSAMPPAAAKAAFEPQYQGVAHFKAQMVPDSRHFIMPDQPEAFATALDAFLAESPHDRQEERRVGREGVGKGRSGW